MANGAGHATAVKAGLPINRMTTPHWGAMGVPDAEAGAALGRLLKLIRDALAAMGLPFAFAWVRENDDGDGSKGSHAHILMHIPAAAGRGFLKRLPAWVRLAAGGRFNRRTRRVVGPAYVKGAVLTRRIGGKLAVAPGVYRVNLALAVDYLLKGADDATAAALALELREPGGRVIGKRCGWSENIGAKARH